MLNKFCKKPLYEVTRTMANVAMGAEKADMVIKNAKLVNVCTAEIQEGIDVAIAEGRIALVGDASHCIGDNTKIIDASCSGIHGRSHTRGVVNDQRRRIRPRRGASRNNRHLHGSARDMQRMRA